MKRALRRGSHIKLSASPKESFTVTSGQAHL